MDKMRKEEVARIFSKLLRLRHSLVHLRMDNMELHRGQPPILHTLIKTNNISQKVLAEAMGVAPSTMTLSLNRMESAGLLRRTNDEVDQRVRRITITEKGRQVAGRMKDMMNSVEMATFEGITDDEIDMLSSIFERMLGNITHLIEQEKER